MGFSISMSGPALFSRKVISLPNLSLILVLYLFMEKQVFFPKTINKIEMGRILITSSITGFNGGTLSRRLILGDIGPHYPASSVLNHIHLVISAWHCMVSFTSLLHEWQRME